MGSFDGQIMADWHRAEPTKDEAYRAWWQEVNSITEEEWRLHINPENSLAKRLFEAKIETVEAANYLNFEFAKNHKLYIERLLEKIRLGLNLWDE